MIKLEIGKLYTSQNWNILVFENQTLRAQICNKAKDFTRGIGGPGNVPEVALGTISNATWWVRYWKEYSIGGQVSFIPYTKPFMVVNIADNQQQQVQILYGNVVGWINH